MFFNRKSTRSSSTEPGHSFPDQSPPLGKQLARGLNSWRVENIPLFEAICVAVSAHILAFPIFWFAGWALPWPKSPEILTVIEIDLTHWTEGSAETKKVHDIIKSEMHAVK